MKTRIRKGKANGKDAWVVDISYDGKRRRKSHKYGFPVSDDFLCETFSSGPEVPIRLQVNKPIERIRSILILEIVKLITFPHFNNERVSPIDGRLFS